MLNIIQINSEAETMIISLNGFTMSISFSEIDKLADTKLKVVEPELEVYDFSHNQRVKWCKNSTCRTYSIDSILGVPIHGDTAIGIVDVDNGTTFMAKARELTPVEE